MQFLSPIDHFEMQFINWNCYKVELGLVHHLRPRAGQWAIGKARLGYMGKKSKGAYNFTGLLTV